MTCERWDVVVTPFPFTGGPEAKRRPALALSQASFNSQGFTVMAMITTAADSAWPGDVAIDHESAGLGHACLVRMKLFTIDSRLIIKRVGTLTAADRKRLTAQLRRLLPV